MRDGNLNYFRFGSRMRGEGIFADEIAQMSDAVRRKAGLPEDAPAMSAAGFRKPEGAHLGVGI
jgi:hypothetical protein